MLVTVRSDLVTTLYYVILICFPFTVHFISIKPVLNDHLSYVTIFHCLLEGHTRQVWL